MSCVVAVDDELTTPPVMVERFVREMDSRVLFFMGAFL
jgi:hypothetical protein